MAKNKDELSSALDDLDSGLSINDINIDEALHDSPDPLAEVRSKDYATHHESHKAVMSEALKVFKASAKNEQALLDQATDCNYFFCVAFKNRDQKDAFLAGMKWDKCSDEDESYVQYLDGLVLAKRMGIPMPDAINRFITQERAKSLATSPSICIDPKTAQKSLNASS